MILKKDWLKMAIGIILACSLTACGSMSTTVIETDIYSFDIDGNKIYYSADDPEAISIMEVVEGFLQSYTDIDYNNYNSMAEQEYYTQHVREENIANNLPQINEQMISNNKLIISLDTIEPSSIKFSNVGENFLGDVRCTYVRTYKNATDAYLKETDTELNTAYRSTIEVKLEKEGGHWKIYKIVTQLKEKA